MQELFYMCHLIKFMFVYVLGYLRAEGPREIWGGGMIFKDLNKVSYLCMLRKNDICRHSWLNWNALGSEIIRRSLWVLIAYLVSSEQQHEIGHIFCNKGEILNSYNLSVLLNIIVLCFIKYLLTEKIENVHLV